MQKQNDIILIDGCNVAECEDYAEKHDILMPYGKIKTYQGYCYSSNDYCNGKDCHFKQLQRLKKENEELKQYKQSKQASYEAMQREWNYAINTLRDVEAKNEKLKKELTVSKKLLKETQHYLNTIGNKTEEIKKASITLAEGLNFRQEIVEKYKTTLEYIRDLNNKTVKIPIITEKINEVLNVEKQ